MLLFCPLILPSLLTHEKHQTLRSSFYSKKWKFFMMTLGKALFEHTCTKRWAYSNNGWISFTLHHHSKTDNYESFAVSLNCCHDFCTHTTKPIVDDFRATFTQRKILFRNSLHKWQCREPSEEKCHFLSVKVFPVTHLHK